MAKRKKAQPWDAVFDRVRVIYDARTKYPPKTTDEELDSVEEELGVQFPLSYRAFATQHGLGGELCGGVELLNLRLGYFDPEAPMEYPNSLMKSTNSYRRLSPEQYQTSTHDYSATEIERLVVFGSCPSGERFVFFPTEVTDPLRRECRVYSKDADYGLVAVADSFASWLSWVKETFFDSEEGEAEAHYPRVFKPNPPTSDFIPYWAGCANACIKIVPAAPDVTLWLAFNNHTASDLALAIRDHGRTDAFPILADALQEAGCTNADLLDSCRTGDPDIDGAWVLRVLLGEP